MNLLPIFRVIPSFPMYSISEDGETVVNLKTGHKLEIRKRNGYRYVTLRKVALSVPKAVHLLVAEAYLQGSKQNVWILDGLKENTHYSNLMHSEGKQVIPTTIRKRKPTKPLTKRTRLIRSRAIQGEMNPRYAGDYLIKGKVYHSARKAGEVLGISHKAVIKRCNSKTRCFADFKFEKK